ncbi:unnamed protein product [Dibothriocephalus latus]|uniref:Fibronectin type-III domain-containing protein n=1 Tax=Dibothriocephalus latus TaxID=60516 RepID=A0A3P7NU24_DIBLA|nr:unnamed protein product [Dibothriocephalus latus]
MKPPQGLTVAFRASAIRKDGSRKSCVLTSENNVLSCEITELRPNSTYTVVVESCPLGSDCSAYGKEHAIRTMPGVPRYVSVSHRTTTTFTVSWYHALEDPNGHYQYKVRAVQANGHQGHTCSPQPAGSFQSCQLTNLKAGWNYEVSVSACTSENFCSDSSLPVSAETLPNPPFGQDLNEKHPDSLDIAFLTPDEERKSGRYYYIARLEPVNRFKSYSTGCTFSPPLEYTICSVPKLAEGTNYNFRVFSCHLGSHLCSEGTPVVVDTYPGAGESFRVTRLSQTSAHLTWHQPYNEMHSGVYTYVYAVPVDSTLGEQQCYNGHPKQPECTLQNLRPDTEYKIVSKSCSSEAHCSYLTEQFRLRTPKPVTVSSPTDIQALNGKATSFTLTWTRTQGGSADALEYWVSLTAPDHPGIPERTVACEAISHNGKQICEIGNLQTDMSYSARVLTCATDEFCAAPSKPITFSTATKAFEAVVHSSSVSVTIKQSEGLTGTFRASAVRNDGSRRSCILTSVDNELSCEIGHLQPYSKYTVVVESCPQGGVCSTYGDNYNILTMPGGSRFIDNQWFKYTKLLSNRVGLRYFVKLQNDFFKEIQLHKSPRYVTIAHRTNSTYSVSWYNSLEDPNGHYVYKVRAIEEEHGQTFTCTPKNAGNYQTCQVTNLRAGWKYEVSVSACTSESFCSDNSKPVIAETLPNPPFGQDLNEKHPDSLDIAFLTPDEERKSGRYYYIARLEIIGRYYEGHTTGCGFNPPLQYTICSVPKLAEGSKYKFRVFACTMGSRLCSEGTPVVVETYPGENDRIYAVGADGRSVFVSWRANRTNPDGGYYKYELRIKDWLGRNPQKVRLNAGKEMYDWKFSGIGNSDAHYVDLDVCNSTNCTSLSSARLITNFKREKRSSII